MAGRWAAVAVTAALAAGAACGPSSGLAPPHPVGASGLASSTTGAVTTTTDVPLGPVNWSAVEYPLSCGTTLQGPVGTQVDTVAYAQPAPGIRLAIVMVACQAGAGTPPRVVYVFTGTASAAGPHLVQTLSDDGTASGAFTRVTETLSVDGPTVTTTGATYSSPAVARCCPDGTFTARWTWSVNNYEPSTSPSPAPATPQAAPTTAPSASVP
jgi:hypothetical protein